MTTPHETKLLALASLLLGVLAATIWTPLIRLWSEAEPPPAAEQPAPPVPPPPDEIGGPWWMCLYHRPTATMRWCNVITGQWAGAC